MEWLSKPKYAIHKTEYNQDLVALIQYIYSTLIKWKQMILAPKDLDYFNIQTIYC